MPPPTLETFGPPIPPSKIIWYTPDPAPLDTPWRLITSFVALLLASGAVGFVIYALNQSPASKIGLAVPIPARQGVTGSANAAEPIALAPHEVYPPPPPAKPTPEDQMRQWWDSRDLSTRPPSVNQKPIRKPAGGERGERGRKRWRNADEEAETRSLNQGQLR